MSDDDEEEWVVVDVGVANDHDNFFLERAFLLLPTWLLALDCCALTQNFQKRGTVREARSSSNKSTHEGDDKDLKDISFRPMSLRAVTVNLDWACLRGESSFKTFGPWGVSSLRIRVILFEPSLTAAGDQKRKKGRLTWTFFFFLRRRYIFGGESGVKALLVLATHTHTHTHSRAPARTYAFSASLPPSHARTHMSALNGPRLGRKMARGKCKWLVAGVCTIVCVFVRECVSVWLCSSGNGAQSGCFQVRECLRMSACQRGLMKLLE